jgi:predicted RNA-binding Zn-ribbon protein involved in translation (DUF1610 family)
MSLWKRGERNLRLPVMPRCTECGRELREGERGWRAFLVAAEEREFEFDGPDVSALFCPGCGEREVGLLKRTSA